MEKIPHSLIKEKLTSRFGSDVISVEEEPMYQVLVAAVKPNKIIEVLKFLYDDRDLQFRFLTSLFGVHYPERKGEEIGLIYLLHNLWRNTRIRIKTYLPIGNPEIDTATNLFATANWMERETYDFFGVMFRGHPNLKRILNIDSMDYFPMRKEYPLEEGTRRDKDDTMFGRDKITENSLKSDV